MKGTYNDKRFFLSVNMYVVLVRWYKILQPFHILDYENVYKLSNLTRISLAVSKLAILSGIMLS